MGVFVVLEYEPGVIETEEAAAYDTEAEATDAVRARVDELVEQGWDCVGTREDVPAWLHHDEVPDDSWRGFREPRRDRIIDVLSESAWWEMCERMWAQGLWGAWAPGSVRVAPGGAFETNRRRH